jgi:cytochrome c553
MTWTRSLFAALLLLASARGAETDWRARIEADWLLQDARRGTPVLVKESDAAGGVDGVKDGKWGFHTADELNPWWQVDLQQSVKIGRVVLYNRCDLAARNARILVLVSDDGKEFRQVYQHNGSVFYGFTDGKPLAVELQDVTARFVRLALRGKSYFHLDEVEIYPAGEQRNVALGKPATQSSTSQWSANHAQAAHDYPVALVVERGLKLAESQRRLGVAVDKQAAVLRRIADELKSAATPETRRELYFRAHWAVREMALANPLLNFDELLFVKRAPGIFPHMSDQHYGWWSRPGGGVCVASGFKTGAPQVRCLTADMPEGSFTTPELSFDGKKILFAYCRYYPTLADEKRKSDKANVPADAFYHVFVMNRDGSDRHQLTSGKYEDFDAHWLPDSNIVFLSTRKGLAPQVTAAYSDSTRTTADLPDSYVRCGGDAYRPVPVFTLHAMEADGRNIRPLSAFENFEWTPSVASDGRILYTRWDYIDRFNGHFFSLWSANPDGTNPQLVYGNYTVRPQVKFEARSVPGSSRLVITAGAHHSITGGALALLDRARGTEEAAPLTPLTPDVCWPETGGWPEHYYANPWPLSEEFFLTAWSAAKLPPHCRVDDSARNPPNAMGLYLLDAFGNQELLYRDETITSMYPQPLAARPRPPVVAPLAKWDGPQEGGFLVQDVYRGLAGVPRGSIKSLRVVAMPPKVQPNMNSPSLGISKEDPGKFILGTVPVESDGSAFVRVPSGVPLFFQALDGEGLAVQTMRSLTYVMPGQTLACIGCHESRETAPATGQPVLATLRPPAKITPGPAGSWPLRFDQLVQPVLDRSCVRCHQPGGQAAKLDLTPAKAYDTLLASSGKNIHKLAFERDRSFVGECVAANSKLWQLLAAGHGGVKLTADDRARLATWLDTYAHRLGHYSDAQEQTLAALRTRWAHLLNTETKP